MPTINDQTPANTAAKNIASVIDAMTEAQKSQLDLKKAVMMKQIGDKMDLAQKAKEQQLEVQKPIQQLQAWEQFGNQGDQTQTNGLNGAGRATNATAGTVGAQPMLPGQPQANPMAPTPMPQPTPQQTLQGQPAKAGLPAMQPIVPPGTTQAPPNAMLSRPAAGSVPGSPGGQPIMPTSIQYNNLGYKPVEAQQLVQNRRQLQQPINMADRAYVQALKKVKANTATQGEIDMVHKMNNRDEDGQPLGQPDNQNSMQTALRELEKQRGYPPNALTFGADGNPTINEFVKSAYDIHQRAEELRADKYGKDVDNMFLKAVSNRSGGMGLEDTKVNNAIHARVALDQYYDEKTGKYNIPPTMHTELALSLARQLSPNGQVGIELTRELTQGSFEENAKKLMIFMGANPQTIGGTTQSIAKTLADALDRQGLVSQSNRDKNYFEPLTHMYSYQKLQERDPQAAKELYENHIGGDYKKFLSLSPQQRQDYIKGLDTKLGIQNSSQTADQGTQSFDSEADAEAANLPSGTIITINGRRAQVN